MRFQAARGICEDGVDAAAIEKLSRLQRDTQKVLQELVEQQISRASGLQTTFTAKIHVNCAI